MTIVYEHIDGYSNEILIRKFLGTVDVDEIIKSWDSLVKNNEIKPEHKGVINVLESAHLDMNMQSFQRLIKFLKDNPALRKLKLAVVCSKPKDIVYPIMAEFGEGELLVKTFTTLEAAVNWVSI